MTKKAAPKKKVKPKSVGFEAWCLKETMKGCDIHSDQMAGVLQRMADQKPALVTITKVMMPNLKKPGFDGAWFGAIITKAGREWLKNPGVATDLACFVDGL